MSVEPSQTSKMDIKVLQKSNTFSTLSTGGSKIGSWFDRRARKLSMKCSKSISVLGKTKLYFIRSCNYSRCKYEIFQSTISVVDSICPFNCLISNPLSILLLSKVYMCVGNTLKLKCQIFQLLELLASPSI